MMEHGLENSEEQTSFFGMNKKSGKLGALYFHTNNVSSPKSIEKQVAEDGSSESESKKEEPPSIPEYGEATLMKKLLIVKKKGKRRKRKRKKKKTPKIIPLKKNDPSKEKSNENKEKSSPEKSSSPEKKSSPEKEGSGEESSSGESDDEEKVEVVKKVEETEEERLKKEDQERKKKNEAFELELRRKLLYTYLKDDEIEMLPFCRNLKSFIDNNGLGEFLNFTMILANFQKSKKIYFFHNDSDVVFLRQLNNKGVFSFRSGHSEVLQKNLDGLHSLLPIVPQKIDESQGTEEEENVGDGSLSILRNKMVEFFNQEDETSMLRNVATTQNTPKRSRSRKGTSLRRQSSSIVEPSEVIPTVDPIEEAFLLATNSKLVKLSHLLTTIQFNDEETDSRNEVDGSLQRAQSGRRVDIILYIDQVHRLRYRVDLRIRVCISGKVCQYFSWPYSVSHFDFDLRLPSLPQFFPPPTPLQDEGGGEGGVFDPNGPSQRPKTAPPSSRRKSVEDQKSSRVGTPKTKKKKKKRKKRKKKKKKKKKLVDENLLLYKSRVIERVRKKEREEEQRVKDEVEVVQPISSPEKGEPRKRKKSKRMKKTKKKKKGAPK